MNFLKSSGNKPPQIKANPIVKHKFRFSSATGTTTEITSNNLITCCGNIATTTTNVRAIAYAVKVNQISIWSPPAAQGSNSTCSVNWFGLNSPNVLISDTTVSVATPALIHSKPPPKSVAAFWNNGGTNNSVIDITAPSGSIIDVDLSFVFNDNANGAGLSSTVIAKTVGDLYYSGLDGTFTSTSFPPISLPN